MSEVWPHTAAVLASAPRALGRLGEYRTHVSGFRVQVHVAVIHEVQDWVPQAGEVGEGHGAIGIAQQDTVASCGEHAGAHRGASTPMRPQANNTNARGPGNGHRGVAGAVVGDDDLNRAIAGR